MNLMPVMSGSWNLTVSSVAMGFAIDVWQPLLIYVLPQFAENFNIAQTNINTKELQSADRSVVLIFDCILFDTHQPSTLYSKLP